MMPCLVNLLKQLNLVEFWMRFDCAIELQRDKDSAFDHDKSSLVPQLRANCNLEKHTRQLYTHKNFHIFSEGTVVIWYGLCGQETIKKLHHDDWIKLYIIEDSGKLCSKLKREVLLHF